MTENPGKTPLLQMRHFQTFKTLRARACDPSNVLDWRIWSKPKTARKNAGTAEARP